MTKGEYSAKHKRRMILFEKQFLRPVFNTVYSQIEEFISDVKAHGLEQAKRNLDRIHINAEVGKVIRELFLTVGLYFVQKTVRELHSREVKDSGFGQNEQWIQDLLAYFKSDLLTKVVLPISETTKNQILEVLIKAEREGWGVDQIIAALQEPDITLARARLIVRTETAQAMFYGQERGIQDSNFETEQTWIATEDHRTRHSHRMIDGAVVNTGVLFKVARFKGNQLVGYDYMRGPGDPTASIENLANCRCTKVVRVKRDENGRAIRKQHLTAA